MLNIGMPELILILVVALLIFGPTKLPELARSLGKGLAEFRRASSDLRSQLLDPPVEAPRPTPPAEPPAAPPAMATAVAPEGTTAVSAVPAVPTDAEKAGQPSVG